MSLLPIGESDKLSSYRFLIEVSEFVLSSLVQLLAARMGVQIVIGAKIVFIQNFIHHFATGTAKIFVVRSEMRIAAGVAAVVTVDCNIFDGIAQA